MNRHMTLIHTAPVQLIRCPTLQTFDGDTDGVRVGEWFCVKVTFMLRNWIRIKVFIMVVIGLRFGFALFLGLVLQYYDYKRY